MEGLKIVLRIVVDEREKGSEVPSFLRRMGVYLVFAQLGVGDYVISEKCAVERKEVRDFMSSIFSGRLFDQAGRLVELYSRSAIVVEGDFKGLESYLEKPKVFWGAVSSLIADYGVSVVFTGDEEETAMLLYGLAKREQEEKALRRVVVKKRLPKKSLREQQLYVLQSLPGIGATLAERLLEKFGSLRGVFTASPAELRLVKGMTWEKAEELHKLFNEKAGGDEEPLM